MFIVEKEITEESDFVRYMYLIFDFLLRSFR